jgi:hypothetical protein
VDSSVCLSCRRPKATVECEVCFEPVCKNCEKFLDASTFSFYEFIPEPLSHTHYCPSCYDAQVAPALESYEEIMERARGAYIFFETQKKQIPLLKRSKETLKVEACEDRDETILRLAFLAAEQGFNSVVEVKVISEKVRNEGYQKTRWSGVGVAAEVDVLKMARF